MSEKRLFLTARGDIGYTLKTPYRDGTTHVIFEPLDFIARLPALVPPPRQNPGSSPGQVLTRFHGVFAPISAYRARITPARRGRGTKPTKSAQTEDRTPAEQRSAMQWAKRLKRVFQIDVETCPKCGGAVKVIASTRNGSTSGLLALRASRPCVLACAEDPPVIERILNHLASKDLPGLWAESRAPPVRRIGLHSLRQRTAFRSRLSRARCGVARPDPAPCRPNGIAFPSDWRRQGGIG
ncbi:hypothetical protein G3I74_07185 [Wenzhouxiangella sp. C33]|uniref:Transposase IS801/IS1294 domain-containing protein n=1 Tax=Wenzhouxiangella limi TaxID=2707351 RepID=A0A845UYC6_9GAMM|nr:hypothetical protein [Wenzhouxiangella limi]